jgi:acyl dehydratase
MLTAGLMARVVKDWFGPTALRKYWVRFSKQVWPGDTLTFDAAVTALDTDAGTVDLALTATNQDGVVVMSGTATAAAAS